MGLPDSTERATSTVGDVTEMRRRSSVDPAWEPIAVGVVERCHRREPEFAR